MSTQKVYPTYSFQYIQNKLVELSRTKLNSADVVEQVQADWTETDIFSPAYIKNKPTLPGVIGDVTGPSSSVDGDVVLFDGTTGKLIKDSGVAFTDVMLKSVYDTDTDGIVDTAEKIMIEVINHTGATLTKGKIVYINSTSSSSNYPEVLLADNTSEATSSKTIGAIYADIANGATGYIVTNGQVHGIDTSAYSVGDKLWLGTSGNVITTPPTQPNHSVFIGHITRSQVSNGRIFYQIQNGFELQELHNVLITSVANNDVLVYESSTSLWKNKTLATILGYTPVPTTRTLTINGTAYDLSADRTWTISSGGMSNPMTTLGDIIYQDSTPAPARLAGNTTTARNFLTQTGNGTISAAPAWFNLFGTSNTWSLSQTIQLNGAVNRTLILQPMSGSSSLTAFAGTAGQAISFSSGAFGIIVTHNQSFNAPWIYPIFTLANRAIASYTATVPQLQLRISTLSGITERSVEWAMPTNQAFTTYDVAIRYDLFSTSSSYRFVQHYMRTSIDTSGALATASALLHIGAAATGYAQINLKTSAGTNPSAPADGDIWYDGTNLKMRVGATTKTFTLI